MALYELENEFVRIGVEAHGAELRSLVAKETGREYMWSGDPAYWGRVSPLLFPVVGAYRDGISRYRGQTYRMSQHGFARDMDFMVTEQSKTEIWFCLTDSDETWEKYPFAFSLEAGYRLEGALEGEQSVGRTPVFFHRRASGLCGACKGARKMHLLHRTGGSGFPYRAGAS